MIYDTICYNGEKELFDLRYNILKNYVDEFIVVEFDKTFSGKDKPIYFTEEMASKYTDKPIKHNFITENLYDKYKELAFSSPNTQYGKGAEHWIREFAMKESIKDCLTHLQDDDIVFISDTDEIVEPLFYASPPEKLTKFKLRVYTYWLNNRSSEVFWGPICARYKEIKDNCLNHLRNNHERKNTINECGWHFTSLKDNLRQKLTDSYTEETYATKQVMDSLEKNIKDNKDFLGRDFTYHIEEDSWPVYLKENREKYKHLCK